MKKLLLLSLLAIPFAAHTQSACGNRDFEDTTFSNWSGATGINSAGFYVPISWTPGIVTTGPNAWAYDPNNQMSLITQNFLDSNCIDPATNQIDTQMTSLAPGGGYVSVRLGNALINMGAEKLVYSFTVTTANPVFQYQFATVMQDPGHQPNEQPFFMVNFWDSSNAIIAGSDTIYSADTAFPFIPGANQIQYRRWTPQSIDLSAYIGQTITVEFVNADCAFGGHFGYTYIDVSCIGTLIGNVWPGDCDYDLQANNMDVLSLGIAYGSTGTTRAGASNTWVAQPSADWPQQIPLGANYKHSDCNGDGVVDLNDTTALILNYAQTHPFRYANPGPVHTQSMPQLYLVPSADTVGPANYVDVDVYVGNASQPVSNLYGLSFDLTYNNAYVQPVITTDFTGSALGVKNTSMIALGHNTYTDGNNGVGICRITHTEFNGYGFVCRIRLQTANLSSLTDLDLAISNVHAIDVNMTTIPLITAGTTIVIDPSMPAGIAQDGGTHFSFFPNPANETVTVNHGTDAMQLTITNTIGQEVYRTATTGEQTQVDVSAFAPGIYFVNVVSSKGTSTQQLVVE